jgi:hypothetical protein
VDEDLDHTEEMYFQNNGEFLVGECAGRLIAVSALKRTTNTRAVLANARPSQLSTPGFGRAILNALEEQARRLGYTEPHLDTTVQRKPQLRNSSKRNGYVFAREGPLGGFAPFLRKEVAKLSFGNWPNLFRSHPLVQRKPWRSRRNASCVPTRAD